MTTHRDEPSESDGLGITDRRTFLKVATGGAALTAAGVLGGIVPSASVDAASSGNDLTWLPAWRIRELIGKKEVSPVEVTAHFLARIEQLNPTLKAFKHVDAAGARERARKAEETVRRGEKLGPLHGIPISFKEHIAVAGMPVMGLGRGSDAIAARDDVGVARLRAAGAVIVGTNTMMGTSAPARGQYNWDAEARNPWDPTRTPGWSTSGGAATAAARLLPIVIGSDGGGSTRLPSALSGVVGFHPSVGRIPTVSYEQPRLNLTGTIGPLARDVRDAAIVMQALAGPDGRDFACIKDRAPDYLTTLDKGVAEMRFAWTDDYGFGSTYALKGTERLVAAVRQAAMGFGKLGARVEPTAEKWEDFWQGNTVTQQIFASVGASARPTPEQVQRALETRGRNFQRFYDLLSKYDLLLT